ncbi:winged helix-turn-helix domain-containing protein [Streptomyces xantholiticus]
MWAGAFWGGEPTDRNTVTVHVKRLRERLAAVNSCCCTTDTVRGLGYRMECRDRGPGRSGARLWAARSTPRRPACSPLPRRWREP